jgi:hypothetical protein
MERLSRRAFAALVGGGAAALAGCKSLTGRYERVVDVVDELGCDPTGTEPCEELIRRSAADDTMLWFPPGRYYISEQTVLEDIDNLGIVGDRNATFLPPDGFNGYLFNLHVGTLEFRNFDVDIRAANTTAGFRIVADRGFTFENVEFVGRGTHGEQNIGAALAPEVTDPDGVGAVKNVVAKQGSAWAHYKGSGGRSGIYVGVGHEGTLRVVDCHFEEFGNNGIYASGCPGDVQVIGGVYRNNNVAGIRLGGAGSFVEGATIEVDPARYTGPRTREDRAFNMRGVVVSQKPEKYGWKPAGAEIRDCDIRIEQNPSDSSAAVHIWHAGRTVSISNTSIRMDENNPAILRAAQRDSGIRPSSSAPRWVRCRNSSISTSADGRPALHLHDADGSRLENSRIRQTGSGADGILLRDSVDFAIDGGSIRAGRYPVYIRTTARSNQDLGDCLVALESNPRLETTEQWRRTLEDDAVTIEQAGWLSPPTCVRRQLLEDVSGVHPRARDIVISDNGGGSLLISAVEHPQ